MKYNTLGHTGLLVSELCLGTMTFAPGEGMWKSVAGVEQKLADELVGLSLDAGINFVDTADVYTNGESEKVLAQAIAPPRKLMTRTFTSFSSRIFSATAGCAG